MRDDLAPGRPFPDLALPEHTGKELTLSGIAAGQPLVLAFVRGWWCPKEQIRVQTLVAMQDEITREEQPSYDPVSLWANEGAGAPDAGIEAPAVWVRENSQGHELQRGTWSEDELPELGARVSRSPVDGRWWQVVDIRRAGDRVAVHLRKEGEPGGDPHLVRHRMTVPRRGRG